MMGFFENWLIPLLQEQGLLIVFVTMVAESACVPIPSEIVVPYGGFLAAQGHTHVWLVIAVATGANMVGSAIAYVVGRYGGRALFLKYGRYILIREHHLNKADCWFERRGQMTVFFTRMMPGVRTFISLPAGIAKMPVGKFFLYSLLGSIPWNAALAYLGYGAGKAAGDDPWSRLQEQFHQYNMVFYVALGAAVAAVVVWVVWRQSRKRAQTACEETAEESSVEPGADEPPTQGES